MKYSTHPLRKIITLIFLANCIFMSAQISEGGLPRSYKNYSLKSASLIESISLPALDIASLESYNEMQKTPYRYAAYKTVDIDLKGSGSSTTMPDGGTLWRYGIRSENGVSIQVEFKKYIVPDGAELYVYTSDYSIIKGAFTRQNTSDGLGFIIGDVPGKYIIVEYYEPADAPFKGQIVIGGIGQAYIDIFDKKSGSTDSDGYIAVNCSEGKEWQEQKHSVCKITFNDGEYSYLCSGALINNTNNDGTPYFLTANHCISTAYAASTVVAYFNYETNSCTNSSPNNPESVSGSELLTTGSASDYTLLRFNSNIPVSYKPFFAGWDISGDTLVNSTSIHHPHGITKKISVDYDSSAVNDETISWEGGGVSPVGSHWKVLFDEGMTAGGSSGGPLFNEEKRIVGQLHGGSSYDYYGKLDYSWTHANKLNTYLTMYLDPSSSSITMLDGYYPSGNLPDAQFISDMAVACTGAPVSMTGYSAFNPTAWQWSFTPSTVEFLDGTDEYSQNPVVAFSQDGKYSASLIVTNSSGSDITVVNEFISSGQTLAVEAVPSGLPDSCICTFDGMYLKAYGGNAFLWTLSDEADDYFYLDNNTANPVGIKVIDGITLTENTQIDISLTGIHGTCQNQIDISIPLEIQPNDNIENAIDLSTGSNGPYSNSCASIQTGEPVPPYTSCTGQLSWCNEYGTGKDIVENSVWFRFVPKANQTIKVRSSGFDNQIAVYKAKTYSLLLSGDYTLIGANDDFTDTNSSPEISSIKVLANQNYWIQVDGSGGGLTGTFNINISVLSSVEDTEFDNSIRVYPVPADNFVNIESPFFPAAESITVEMFNSAAASVYTDICTGGTEKIEIPMLNLPPGIYLVRVNCDGRIFNTKVVK